MNETHGNISHLCQCIYISAVLQKCPYFVPYYTLFFFFPGLVIHYIVRVCYFQILLAPLHR